MELWEEIPGEVWSQGCSIWELWLAWATITLLKYISTSLCQGFGRLCALLTELYHLPHGYTWPEMSRDFPRHLQLNLSFPPAGRQPTKCLCIPDKRRTVVGPGFGMRLSIGLVESQWGCHVNSILVRNSEYQGACKRRYVCYNSPLPMPIIFLSCLSFMLVKKRERDIEDWALPGADIYLFEYMQISPSKMQRRRHLSGEFYHSSSRKSCTTVLVLGLSICSSLQ